MVFSSILVLTSMHVWEVHFRFRAVLTIQNISLLKWENQGRFQYHSQQVGNSSASMIILVHSILMSDLSWYFGKLVQNSSLRMVVKNLPPQLLHC